MNAAQFTDREIAALIVRARELGITVGELVERMAHGTACDACHVSRNRRATR